MTSGPQKRTAIPFVRLVLAWLLTMGVLVYAWARTLVGGRVIGLPEPFFAALVAAGIFAVVLLTRGLSAQLPRRWGWKVFLAVEVPWVLATGTLMGLYAGPQLPWPYVVALFVPATLWVPWAAWMFYWPLSWKVRLGVLALLLFAISGFWLLKVEGMGGDTRLDFAWRWSRPAWAFAEDEPTPPGGVDLTQTTPNDYPQYLGPHRTGVLPHARLAGDWKSPPRQVWRRPVGASWSGFAVVGDYAVTQEQRGEEECVVCYRISDGKLMWRHADRANFATSLGGPGPRATPTIHGGWVYTVGATGILNCLHGPSGQPLWSLNILTDNQAENLPHGVCGSPLVLDERLLVCPTANGLSLVAYDRHTKERLWQKGEARASYGSPLPVELAGVPQVLLTNIEGVTAHDPVSGDVLWSFPWANSDGTNCSQPIANAGAPGQVFISTGYGKGSALFHVEQSADGSWAVQPKWTSRQMKTKFTTPVLYQGHVYGLDDGILACLDLETGKLRWKAGRYGHGQILLAGNRLLVQAEDGAVVLVEPSPEGLRERGRIQALHSKTWNNPALAGRFLLVRNDQEAACYELPLADD